MLRVLHLASGDLWAGAEVQLFHLAVALSKKELDLLVVLLNDGELANNLRQHNIKVQIISESDYGFFKLLVLFNSIVREFKPTVIHTHRTKENLIGGLVGFIYRSYGVRTVHGASEFKTNILSFKRWLLNKLDILVGRILQDTIVAVSDELSGFLKRDFPSKMVVTINNSINIDYVIECSKHQNDVIVNQDKFNIAFVGRFVPVKRVDYFIEAIKSLSENSNKDGFCVYLIGDGPLFEEVKSLIVNNDLSSVVKLTGFMRNIAPTLKQMNLLAITSDHEGLPMTLLEAMALKVPVISRNLPTIKNVLCGGECGVLLKEDACAEGMAEAIENLMYDKDILARLSADAFSNLSRKYSIDSNVEQYMNLYIKQ